MQCVRNIIQQQHKAMPAMLVFRSGEAVAAPPALMLHSCSWDAILASLREHADENCFEDAGISLAGCLAPGSTCSQ